MATHGSGGTLHLGAVPTFATRWLIPRLPQFHTQHPDITVHIDTRTRPFLFADSGFDAALFAGTPEQIGAWAGTQATRLMAEVVLPVCSPALLQGGAMLSPADIAALPLLQQSTRPNAWRLWFEASGVPCEAALAGARFEQFSMTAAAAACGMGVALVPRLLIEGELARGELVVACDQPLPDERAVYLVQPQRDDARPALGVFAQWLSDCSRKKD
jgi:LysR family glycine cleavage system transcriptional activator